MGSNGVCAVLCLRPCWRQQRNMLELNKVGVLPIVEKALFRVGALGL